MNFTHIVRTLLLLLTSVACACACAPSSATRPLAQGEKMPHVQVDVNRKQVRVDCQMLGVETPLEFFCVLAGTNEHESVLRTPATPSHIHAALLMLGLEPGEPVKYSEAAKKWFAPHGPPLSISVEYEKDGKTVSLPAHRLMRSIEDKKPQPAHAWIFAGSRVMPDGMYAADVTGYIVSVVNFDLSLIDIPELASNANETLEWQIDPEVAPSAGTRVTMVIEPTGKLPPRGEDAPATRASAAGIDVPVIKLSADGMELNDVKMTTRQLLDELRAMRDERPIRSVRIAYNGRADNRVVEEIRDAIRELGLTVEPIHGDAPRGGAEINQVAPDLVRLRDRWRQAVAPHQKPLRDAAQAHYDVILELRRQQQRLIDQADQIQRLVDELEREYQEMTTPRPQQDGQ
jgi:hypothetical protein